MSDSLPVYTLETLSTLPTDAPLYGVLGSPIAHSLSPVMQLAAFQKIGQPAHYVRIATPPERLAETVAKLRGLGFAGWNCTVPLKIEMMALLDEVRPSAHLSGTCNTVVNEGGRLIGFSTDGEGWARAVREDFGVEVGDLRILLLGTGGAGQAVARQAAQEKCVRLVLVNRTFEKAQALVEKLRPQFITDRLAGAMDRLRAIPWEEAALETELEQIDLLVNTTSVGLHAHDILPISPRLISPSLLVYDLIYRPAWTKLLITAADRGARASNGLGMLLHQGAAAFTLWTGQPAPLSEMRAALQKALTP